MKLLGNVPETGAFPQTGQKRLGPCGGRHELVPGAALVPTVCGFAALSDTCLRRFAVGLIKSKSRDSVAATIQKLARKVRRIFDYLCMTAGYSSRFDASGAQAW
ncbi:MAG TPA: hypothetical protein EYP19_06680 [Desulfobacterales bacterium]|nr:hypothetical protein [Desulfobacterales bacterium]